MRLRRAIKRYAKEVRKEIVLHSVGLFVGELVGFLVGDSVGFFVGDSVGFFVGDCMQEIAA